MIGNSFPYLDSGYSILEQGDLDPSTFQLKVSSYLVADRGGDTIAEFPTKAEAEAYLQNLLTEKP